ncbi:MAG TPA: helix-turn-helix domain-containing protein [Lachnospiraceae bacterium]|nr:helix-turn-helix domain-containing protein [Lachnospiraceae bacterium]
MNTRYLMQHISRHLHTFVRQYTSSGELDESVCDRIDYKDMLIDHEEVKSFLLKLPVDQLPMITTSNDSIVYASVSTPTHLFLIGPVRLSHPSYLKYQLPGIQIDRKWQETIPDLELRELIQDTLLLHNLTCETTLDENDIISFNCIDEYTEVDVQKIYSNLVFENRELGEQHNPYDQEIREFTSIRNGDLNQLQKSWSEDYTGTIGTLAKDKLRHTKNLGIVLVTLASRAAMEGGLLPEIAYSLSDSYINKIEELSDTVSIEHLARQAEYRYTEMVHDLKEQLNTVYGKKVRNPVVNRCKDYIFKNLHDKILLNDIAEELQMNPNYLSEVFKQYEGISISNFIVREKVNLAKNMLIYSQYSYIEIATYLGFASQSHLGKHFRSITGYTPKQYRDLYGVKEFKTDKD